MKLSVELLSSLLTQAPYGALPPLGGRPTDNEQLCRHILPVTPGAVIRLHSNQERCSLPIPSLDSRSTSQLSIKKIKNRSNLNGFQIFCIVHGKMISESPVLKFGVSRTLTQISVDVD